MHWIKGNPPCASDVVGVYLVWRGYYADMASWGTVRDLWGNITWTWFKRNEWNALQVITDVTHYVKDVPAPTD